MHSRDELRKNMRFLTASTAPAAAEAAPGTAIGTAIRPGERGSTATVIGGGLRLPPP